MSFGWGGGGSFKCKQKGCIFSKNGRRGPASSRASDAAELGHVCLVPLVSNQQSGRGVKKAFWGEGGSDL